MARADAASRDAGFLHLGPKERAMSDAGELDHASLGEPAPTPLDGGFGERARVARGTSGPRAAGEPRAKPTHYKVVCISLYTRDIEQLEATVAELKRRGYTKANKSQLIRMALSQLDIDKLPPPTP
jgi:hypothetical protein